MTVSKGGKRPILTLIDTKPNVPKKQVIIFGALISTTLSAIVIGYAIYVSSPFLQQYFLKLTHFGY